VLPSSQGFQSDLDPSNVLLAETLEDFEHDAAEIIGAARRIEPTASGFVETLCAAIEKTGSVGIGMFVDRGFEAFTQGGPPVGGVNLNDPQGGGHWICLTSFRTASDGSRILRGPNSWTKDWGSAGHFEITGACAVQAISDAYALYL
jgi:hypothetical protein